MLSLFLLAILSFSLSLFSSNEAVGDYDNVTITIDRGEGKPLLPPSPVREERTATRYSRADVRNCLTLNL